MLLAESVGSADCVPAASSVELPDKVLVESGADWVAVAMGLTDGRIGVEPVVQTLAAAKLEADAVQPEFSAVPPYTIVPVALAAATSPVRCVPTTLTASIANTRMGCVE